MFSSHTKAVFQALFVAFLWSMSAILIKIGFEDLQLPALTFAGFRYVLAFLILLPLLFRGNQINMVRSLTRRQWLELIVLGLLFYAVNQGAWFFALERLPPVTVSLVINFTAAVVALMGIFLLKEYLGVWQWLGIGLFLVGLVIYLYPVILPADEWIGIAISIIAMLANSFSNVLGRFINREAVLSPLVVTIVSLGIGSVVLLGTGIAIEGLPAIDLNGWILILVLAVVNTALAFTLWNRALQTLSAVESTVIINTMLIQIAIMGWIVLGDTITLLEAIGLLIAGIGILMVQILKR